MAMIGDTELMFLTGGHIPVMDWNTGPPEQQTGGGVFPRNTHHQGDEPSYLTMDSFAPHLSFPSVHQFDVSEPSYPTPKVEPLTSSPSTGYDYYPSPSPQVNFSSRGFNASSSGSSFILQHQSTDAYGNQSSQQQQQQQQGGGALEEIDDALMGNFPDMPPLQPQHPDMDMDYADLPSMYGGHSSQPPRSVGHVTGVSGSPVVSQQQHNRSQWITQESHPESSLDSSSGMSSTSSSAVFDNPSENTSMGGFFPDVPRHVGAAHSNWGGGGKLRIGHSQQQPYQLKPPLPQLQQHQHPSNGRRNPPGLGGGYSQPESNVFIHSSAGFGSSSGSNSNSPSFQLPQQLHRLSSTPSYMPNPIVEQINPNTTVPATGLQLVHFLLACAEAVAENKLNDAQVILARLRSHVLPDGNPMQRLAAYFEQALTARLNKDNSSPIFKGLSGDNSSLSQAEVLEAFSVYYEYSPIGKFGHLTCNQILLDAVEREKNIHVLDLHIWHGMQWPAFLQALALRPSGIPKLRISAVGQDREDLKETGEKLHECAQKMSVPFEYCPILTPLEDFSAQMVDTRPGEVLVINSFVQFHGIVNKGPNSLNKLLSDLRLLNPRVMAFAENDGNHNSSSFLTRFVECLRYYSAVFDAFDASLPPDSPARLKMEQIFAAQKIRNIIACEGPARVDGHEPMKYWHKRLEGARFRCVSLSSRAVSQAHMLLNLYYSRSNGYTLNSSDCGYLTLGWHGMPLTGVSAWQ